jgi:hypothetical protein
MAVPVVSERLDEIADRLEAEWYAARPPKRHGEPARAPALAPEEPGAPLVPEEELDGAESHTEAESESDAELAADIAECRRLLSEAAARHEAAQ